MHGAGEVNERAVIPFNRSAPVREDYVEAIQLWCKTRDTAEILSREEIGAMPHKERMDAQRKALILALAQYYRNHERADVAPGVLAIITILSDNERGCATLSQPTLARLFGRSVSSIGDAQKRLKEDGLITMGRGRFAGTSPVIPRIVTQHYNHTTWIVGALTEADKPLNLPAPPVDCQTTGPARGLNQSTCGTGGLKTVNQPVEPISINRPDPSQLLSKSSVVDVDRAAAVLAIGLATALGAMPAAANPPDPPAIVQPAKLSLAQMSERMAEAAGTAIANPAGSPGLLIYGDLQQWLNSGCDFETDILQTIRAVCARAIERGYQPITTWSYFTKAIANAKAKRLAPMPEGRAPPGRAMSWDDEQLDRKRKLMEAINRRPANG